MTDTLKRKPGRPKREIIEKNIDIEEVSHVKEKVVNIILDDITIAKTIIKTLKYVNPNKLFISFDTTNIIMYTSGYANNGTEVYINISKDKFSTFYCDIFRLPLIIQCISNHLDRSLSSGSNKDSKLELIVDSDIEFRMTYLSDNSEITDLIKKVLVVEKPWLDICNENIEEYPIKFSVSLKSFKRTTLQFVKHCNNIQIICKFDTLKFGCTPKDESGPHITNYTDIQSIEYTCSEEITKSIPAAEILVLNTLPSHGNIEIYIDNKKTYIIYTLSNGEKFYLLLHH